MQTKTAKAKAGMKITILVGIRMLGTIGVTGMPIFKIPQTLARAGTQVVKRVERERARVVVVRVGEGEPDTPTSKSPNHHGSAKGGGCFFY